METALDDIITTVAHFHDRVSVSSIYDKYSRPSLPYNSSSNPTASAQAMHARQPRQEPAASRFQKPSSRDPTAATSPNGSSRFPSPPSSGSPSASSLPPPEYDSPNCMDPARNGTSPHGRPAATYLIPAIQQPSPTSDDFAVAQFPKACEAAGASLPLQHEAQTVHVKDLAHIWGLAQADAPGKDPISGPQDCTRATKYDISRMPIGDIIEMVAALLTKITTTNDLQHDAMQRNANHQQQVNQNQGATSDRTTSGPRMTPLGTSVLGFHGRNIPGITILLYLSRIQRYCPTTFEVFLSLLVYFDRMTERVNDILSKDEDSNRQSEPSAPPQTVTQDVKMRDCASNGSEESYSGLVDDDDECDPITDGDAEEKTQKPASSRSIEIQREDKVLATMSTSSSVDASAAQAAYLVVDSFNIHRLIISGVTCSSKFFSDVFYTNSRYARVGGLPLAELNHLELQFLVINDFRLAIRLEDLEAYATMLVEFYIREVASPRPRHTRGVQVDSQ